MQEIAKEPSELPKWMNFDNLKCSKNQIAKFFCRKQTCVHPALICADQNCECNLRHFKCCYVGIKRVLQGVQARIKQISLSSKQSYKAVYQTINQMIDNLSLIREKLQLSQKYYGLENQQIELVNLIQQSKFQNINGKLVASLQNYLDQLHDFRIPQTKQILQSFEKQKKVFKTICKSLQKSLQKLLIGQIINDSKIIKTISQKNFLYRCLQQISKNPENIKATLVFRASEHNFSSNQFHKKCDGVGNTLVIVKNQYDKIFGGFNPSKWESPQSQHYVKDETGKAFMFSVTLRQKYKCVDPDNSVQNDARWGPIFGKGCDLSISNQADKNTRSGVGFPTSYNLQQNKYQKGQPVYTALVGTTSGYTFKVTEYEVYEISGVSNEQIQKLIQE